MSAKCQKQTSTDVMLTPLLCPKAKLIAAILALDKKGAVDG
jgi:hypothetical protein